MSSVLSAFSWGYKGWGNHTPELIRMVDAVEAARGYEPPLFVDIRLRRQVRAIGFRDHAFERLLGPERYLWVPGLGNAAIGDPSLEMQLADPTAIHILIGRILEQQQRRVIFFCSCESPSERQHCHRSLVVRLLAKTATRCGLPIAVQEWPGGAPVIATVHLDLRYITELRKTRSCNAPLPPSIGLAVAGAIPHFSVLRCRNGDEQIFANGGPAICTSRGRVLPLSDATEQLEDARDGCEQWREIHELETFGAAVKTRNWQEKDLRAPTLEHDQLAKE